MDYKKIADELKGVLDKLLLSKTNEFERAIALCEECLESGHKILALGNGGSAAQAQHFTAELVNRFLKDRPALAAISLTTDTSALTSIANDTCFEDVFNRQIQALGTKGDVALALSTSGESANVIKALEAARKIGIKTIAFTGEKGNSLAARVDCLVDVPSASTPRIQEAHLLLLHLLAQELEERLT